MTTLIPKYDFKNGGTTPSGAINRPINLKLEEVISVKDFGAVGDGSTDDTTAIQNAVDYATSVGGTVFVPKGYYIVSSTINIGLQVYTDYSQATTMVAWYNCTINASNKTANLTKKRIDFVGEAESYIVGNFAPSSITPVIAYNLDNDTTEVTGTVSNLIIISQNQYSGGKLVPTTFDNNNLIGLFVGRGSKVVDKVLFFGAGYGLVALGSYWCTHQNLEATYCGTAYTFNEYNAGNATQLNAVRCATGYYFTGQNGKLSSFNTENCDNDVYIQSADACIIGPAYLEDVRTTGGTGQYAFKLGVAADGYSITETQFNGILTLINLASGKKGWRFWGCANAVLNACRFYGASYDIESLTLGYAYGGDGPTQFYKNGVLTTTFSPFIGDSFGNNFTYNIRTGIASAVNDLVTASLNVSWTSLGSAGGSNLVIALPYVSKNITSQTYSVTLGSLAGFPTSKQLVGTIAPNTNYITFYGLNNLAAPTAINATDCATTGDISLTVTYSAIVSTK